MIKNFCKTCEIEFVKPHNPSRTYKYCSLECMGRDAEKSQNHSKKMIGKVIPWNKGIKGRQPWMNISGFKPGWNKSIPNPEFRGEKNPRWNGGISSINDKLRHTIEIKLWRKAVLERDNYTCQKYGTTTGRLHAHHINNFSEFPELRTAISNGITLSEKAHKEFHKIYGRKNNTKEQIEEYLKNTLQCIATC